MSFVIVDACPPNCQGICLGDGNHSGCGCKGDGAPCDCPKHVVKTVEKLGCDVTYEGLSYPQFHGTKCEAPYHASEDERHYSRSPCLAWYTPEQKARAFVKGI